MIINPLHVTSNRMKGYDSMKKAVSPANDREEVLEQWFIEYGTVVLRTCFLFLRDRALAEDAMQDTFIKAWKRIECFEGRHGSSVKTWLIRIAINTCHDYKRVSWFKHIDLSIALENLPPSILQIEQESRDVFIDVLRLPQRFRQVVLLRVFNDCTIKETAEILQISQITVIRRLKKASELLRIVYRE